ncbi:hypothetical protein CKAN_01087800 [Cinnamomum micranthum f. kanehirae]|uniref:Protein EMBRYO SAC DEVELOPMENT ARREST 3, chloroplastic n=1 Tax=Cinnamomum micranthum f. kanehirae TaxID=337451 RepID=A0A3S3NLK2_9MAGN|nr:hypothetical protein CKAN_01087800 [Cinnamomum micranthum f. kanehirae]
MAFAMKFSSPSSPSFPVSNSDKIPGFHLKRREPNIYFHAPNPRSTSFRIRLSSTREAHRCRSKLEAMFHYDKPIPEEIIEKPVGLSLGEKTIGTNPRCVDCEAKGVVLCPTCSGSGLYVDSILESQGIIVKVRCLGCGGIGNIMCSECGGRGHCGIK